MAYINIEIKAKCKNQDYIRKILKKNKARFIGTDHQVDTYFKARKGRLKIREGTIENSLIYYNRENKKGPKKSKVLMVKLKKNNDIKEILKEVLKVSAVVDKKREIYFIKNIKFHIDNVRSIGKFMEIEAIDENGKIGRKKLLSQCRYYLKLFKINKSSMVNCSYSDMLKNKLK